MCSQIQAKLLSFLEMTECNSDKLTVVSLWFRIRHSATSVINYTTTNYKEVEDTFQELILHKANPCYIPHSECSPLRRDLLQYLSLATHST